MNDVEYEYETTCDRISFQDQKLSFIEPKGKGWELCGMVYCGYYIFWFWRKVCLASG